MRLAALLAEVSDDELERLAVEHVRTDEKLARPQLCNFLEGAIRSYRFVNDFIVNRQPPAFSILTLLLESPAYARPIEGFRDTAMNETRRIMDLIDAGELLGRDRQLHLYRRAFYEARRNDLDVNASEAAILAVLRREQHIAQVEHFLIEHHTDLREFWDRDGNYQHELHALRSAGLVFHSGSQVMIPEDVAPAVSQTLGIDMPIESARRLFGYLSNTEMADVLAAAGARTSGSKEQRLERILSEWIQPRTALQAVALSTLKDICRATDAASSGNKDDLIERIVAHFAQGRDRREEEPAQLREPEPRHLTQIQFETLFSALTHQELSDILREQSNLRQTGTKETKIHTLWHAQLSETTLLSQLMNRQLEDILHRLGLQLSGSKGTRLDRIIQYFANTPTADTANKLPQSSILETEPPIPTAEVAANQSIFRQRASNPQASLQPWLDSLLRANGLVRCYATEDANPTKQLKNKLSQAAAARDGLLVLLLSDESAYLKAREALVERWLTNNEWSKNVACIALAYPTAAPTVSLIVEKAPNRWSGEIRTKIFPHAEIVRLTPPHNASATCVHCSHELPPAARFCPQCGREAAETPPS